MNAWAFASRLERAGLLFRRRPPFIDPVSCLSRLPETPACGSLRSGPRLETTPRALAARSVKTSPVCVPARLPSKGAFHRLASRDTYRVRRGTRPSTTRAHQAPTVLPPSGRVLRLFAGAMPRCISASAGASARPPFTSAYLIDAGASLGRSQPFDFCNEFSMYDTRARLHERRPRPPQGVALRTLPRTMRFSRCPHLPLFDAKKVRARCAAASYARFPDAWPREPSPGGPRASAPTSDTFQVGPQDMGCA
jgi:hypothetical protein